MDAICKICNVLLDVCVTKATPGPVQDVDTEMCRWCYEFMSHAKSVDPYTTTLQRSQHASRFRFTKE